MNNIEQKIDEIVNKVLSEELNKKIDEVQSKVEEIDEMEDFYEIAKKRREERKMKKYEPKDDLIGVYSNNSDEDGLINSGDIDEEELGEGPLDRLKANVAGSVARVGTSLKNLGAAVKGDKEAFKSPELQAGLARMRVKFNNFDKDIDGMINDVEKLFPAKDSDKSPELTNLVNPYKELLKTIKDSNNAMRSLASGEVQSESDELDEELKGDQHKIDKNKNGKIDAEDFKMLRKESQKQKLQLTEDEMIELIERIVIQEKSAVEKLEKKNSNETKKTNDDYVKSVTKKMKEYMKNMGVEYNPESDSYPRGNTMMDITDKDGKVKNSDKKQMYTASDSVKQYVDQVAQSGGMENLDYDQIKPDDSRLEKYIEGSSLTGNSDEYANAVKTDVNKNVNKRRKLNILAKLKKMSYQKAEQPVYDIAGNERHDDMMKSLDLASVDEKKKDKINENIEKMRSLIDYNQKTQ